MQVVGRGHQLAVAAVRVVVGIVFLTAGIEKLFLTQGGWSAAGFLKFATGGTPILAEPVEGVIYNPTHEFWVNLAANDGLMQIVNLLVMFGQIGIGVALILGLLTRFGAAMGTLMMLVFFVAAWDFQFGIVNQHLTYAVVTAFLGYVGAGSYFGLDATVRQSAPAWVRRWFLSGGTPETVTA